MIKVREREVNGNVLVIDLVGRMTIFLIDSSNLEGTIKRCVAKNKTKILLNMEGVDVIDVSGVVQLIASFIEVQQARGKLKILNANQQVTGVLQKTGTHRIISMHQSEAEAVASFD